MTIHMVTLDRIAELTKGRDVKLDDVLSFSVDCYEAGMSEVLKEIAEREMENHPPIELTESTKEELRKIENLLNDLRHILDPSELRILEEFNDKYESLNSSESWEYFIAGFLRGYRYLKSIQAHQTKYCPKCQTFI